MTTLDLSILSSYNIYYIYICIFDDEDMNNQQPVIREGIQRLKDS